MALTVLQVAFPLAPVGPDSIGGAEQALYWLDRGVVERGHRGLVVALAGSDPVGTLIPVEPLPDPFDASVKAEASRRNDMAIRYALERWPVDLVHLHGLDALDYLPPEPLPVLITLHLPPDWYPPGIWTLERPSTALVPVSRSQADECPPSSNLWPPISNGLPRTLFDRRYRKAGFAAALGRICPEKGFEHALDAARQAGVALLLAGKVYPYPEHEAYFRRALAPRLDRLRRFLGPLGFAGKRRLLGQATCCLVPSLCRETGSLVALEALATGTPVVAFPHGVLEELVTPGETGFLVRDVAEMADAIHACARIDPDACAAAAARFGMDAMVDAYIDVYRTLIAGAADRRAAG